MSGRSVNLTTLFLGRLRPTKRFNSTKCTNFQKLLVTTLLESAEGEMNVYGRAGISGSRQTRYRLRFPAQLSFDINVYRS